MVQSRSTSCNKGDIQSRDYEDMVNLQHAALACNAMLRGNRSPLVHLRDGITSVSFVQAPSASVIIGEVAVNDKAQHGAISLSAGVIAVVCISMIAILLLCLCMSEIISGFLLPRWQQNTSVLNRQAAHVVHTSAAPEDDEVAGPNASETVRSSGSFQVASTETASQNNPQVMGLKQGLAHWVIKGLPVIKYKEHMRHGRRPVSSNSTSIVASIAYCGGGMMTPAPKLDRNGESTTAVSSKAADHNGLECVVCLSPFKEDEDVRILPRCCHEFHVACIDSWLVLHATCPLCRTQVSPFDAGLGVEPEEANHTIECNSSLVF